MTPAEQVRLALAINSIYEQAPVPGGWDLLDRLFVPEDPQPTALVLRDQESGRVAIAVRGSWTGWDWRQDFRFISEHCADGIGRVEEGFWTYYADMKTESGRRIPPADWVGGHSLGGPAAIFLGVDHGSPDGVQLLTAGSPMPGDAAFGQWASPRFREIHRWENPHDVVPDTPGRFAGYRDLNPDPEAVDFAPLGIHWIDLARNHHLPNYVRAFSIARGLPLNGLPAQQ